MRSISLLAIAWTVVSVGAWVAGRTLIGSSDVSAQTAGLLRDAGIVEQLLVRDSWPTPPDDSKRWSQIEVVMGVDILPLKRSSNETADSAAPRASAGGWAAVMRLGDRLVTSKVIPLQLTLAPPAAVEASAEPSGALPREAEEDSNRITIQLTRSLRPTELGIWDTLCAVLGLSGLGILGGVAARWRWHNNHLHEEIAPWVTAVQKRQAAVPLQLDDLAGPSDLATNLNMVAEHVNQSLAQLHQSVQRNELVLRNLREGVLAVDDRSLVLLANRTLDDHVTLAANNYLMRPLLEVVRTPQIHDSVRSVLDNGTAREEVVQVHQTSKWLRITARPLPLSNGFGVLVTTRDESLLKRIEAIRKDFISNASHELKTPLAAIRAYAETLQLGAMDDRDAAESFLASIVSQVDRIDGLVQGMLQLSRVESGTGMRIETFSANKALEPCLAAAGALARSKDVEFSANCEAELVIESDMNGFQTIASNLLSNAVRYTHAGGSVSLHLRRTLSAGPAVELTVEDNGIGIHPEDLERIFERFYRAEKDRSTETGGTGLGLSIVKHLTTALGGTVSAKSEPGAGSRFQVTLPAKSPGAFLT